MIVDVVRQEMCTLGLGVDLDSRAGMKPEVEYLEDGYSMLVS